MRKSLLITYFFPPKIGGIENYLSRLCLNLPEDKILIFTEKLENASDFDHSYPRPIIRQELFPWRFFKPSWLPVIWQLKKLIKKERIELLQFGHYFNLVTVGLIFKKLFNIPYIVYTHGVDTLIPQKNWLQRKLMYFNLKNAEWIVANTEFMKRKIEEIGIFPSRIIVVYPSLPEEAISREYSGEGIKKKYQLEGKKVILTLGRLVKRKGQDMVIKAMKEVIKKVPEAVYLIVGEGPAKVYLQNLIKELNLRDKVIFAGAIPDRLSEKMPFYKAADVFVMPAREENKMDVESFGLVYLEAQSQGRPVILGNAGGSQESILVGKTGLIVNSKELKEIVQQIIFLLENKEKRKRIGKEARQWVKNNFLWKKQIKKINFLLEKDFSRDKIRDLPLVSIVIPAYKVINYIDDCLKSIFKQSFSNFEVIVVNDGPDKILSRKLEKYKVKEIKRVHFGDIPNQASAARNLGAQVAKGKYLFFCDADIILYPNCLMKMVKTLELNPSVSFCYSGFIFGRKKFRPLRYSQERLKRYNYISTMSLIRRNDFPGFDQNLSRFQDWDLWLNLVNRGKSGLAINEILFWAPMRKEGISKAIPKEIERKKIIKKYNL